MIVGPTATLSNPGVSVSTSKPPSLMQEHVSRLNIILAAICTANERLDEVLDRIVGSMPQDESASAEKPPESDGLLNGAQSAVDRISGELAKLQGAINRLSNIC